MRGFRAKVAGVSYYMMQRSGSRTSIRSSFLAAWRKRTECVRRRSLLEEHEEGERCVLHPEIRSLLRLSLCCCCCCRRLRPTVWGWSSTTWRESCYHSLGLFSFSYSRWRTTTVHLSTSALFAAARTTRRRTLTFIHLTLAQRRHHRNHLGGNVEANRIGRTQPSFRLFECVDYKNEDVDRRLVLSLLSTSGSKAKLPAPLQ